MEVEKVLLGTVDYVIFALMLLVSAGIGVFFRFSGGKQKTTEEYLLAGKDMSIMPVAFSIMATFLSAITVIGVPAEMYKFGIYLAYMNIGIVIGTILSAYLSLPVYFEMQATTAYEYLERRFGKTTRTISSLAFVLQTILYMSVVLYAPALALSAVTNLSTWISVISIGVVCTFYCTLGGMKAVLWTDVFQSILMFLGIFAVLIKGFLNLGGFENVWRIAKENGRITYPGFEFDTSVPYTFWNLMLQGTIMGLSSFAGNQVQIQRMLSVRNIHRSRMAVFVSIPLMVGFYLLNCLAGVVIYAFYYKCDPLTVPNKHIYSADQLMPYFIMQSLSGYPGLPGLCICGIFSASLSTVSSSINSLTAVTMQDLVKPFFSAKGFSQTKMAFCAKLITLLYGLLCIAIAFLVAKFGTIVQASFTMFGMLGGPVLAIFMLGMLTTRTNEMGGVFGLITAVSITAWISIGAASKGPPPLTLPVSIEGCSSPNISTTEFLTNFTSSGIGGVVTSSNLLLDDTVTEGIHKSHDDISPIYRMSYMWFAAIGFFVAFVIGYIASIIINYFTEKQATPAPELLSPLLKYFLKNEIAKTKNEKMEITGQTELQEMPNKV